MLDPEDEVDPSESAWDDPKAEDGGELDLDWSASSESGLEVRVLAG